MTIKLSLLASAATLLVPAIASAQGQTQQHPFRQLDENGVDVTHGDFVLSFKEASIGSGDAELSLIRRNATNRGTDWDLMSFKLVAESVPEGLRVVAEVSTGGYKSEKFISINGAAFVAEKANGAVLTGGPSTYFYTTREGSVIGFGWPEGVTPNGIPSNLCQTTLAAGQNCSLVPISIDYPGGEGIAIKWQAVESTPASGLREISTRLGQVLNSYAYSLEFRYPDVPVTPGSAPPPEWWNRTATQLSQGSLPQGQVSYIYPLSGTVTVRDLSGVDWTITNNSIQRPGEASPGLQVTYPAAGSLQVQRDGVSTGYAWSTNGDIVTLTKGDALGQGTVVVSDMNKGRPISVTDATGATTSYAYDAQNRLTRVTAPEGNFVEYTLDERGNATQTRYGAKPGSGTVDIVTTAAFPATCDNPTVCNQPTSVTDGNSNVTEFTYDGEHGGVLTVTGMATPAGIRPQTRNSYDRIIGDVYKLTGVSVCRDSESCIGSADETRQSFTYNQQGEIISQSVSSGDGTLAATTTSTYSLRGDRLSVDGPLPGAEDTTYYRYDAARRLTGVIAPDPDGSGVLRRKAQRFGYDAAGRRLTSELGTVASADDSGWAGFQSLQREQITLDSNSRVRFSTMSGVNGNLTRTQYSYDALGRMDCTAIRMNPTAWDALPESACTQSNNGINGPDRITQNGYDPLGRVSAARSGVGTAALAEEAATYYRNGQIATVTDANGNRTTYEYDGLDRLLKTKFPVSATGQRVSSDTDFEQLFYSQTNQVVGRRLRDGTVIGFSYDNLNRLVLKDLPGNEPDVTYQYNLSGQLRGATRAGQSVGMQYDALGRIVSEFSPLGTMSYQYDLAGRRTQMAWPDGLNINYDYQVTGEIIGIRENGGAQGPFQLATYTYDDLGRRTRLTRGNGTATNFTYEPGLRLSSWTHDLTGTASDVTVGLTYNPASQIMSRARSNATYAWAGQVATDRPYLVNGLNQYSQAGEVGFGYDARGNLTTSGSTQYAYSSENMLTSTSAGTQLSYDAMLRLTQVDGTLFQYDGLRLIGEYAAGGGTLRRFVYGPGADEPLVIYEGAGSGLPQYLHADERGSIIAVSDNVGNAITTNRYDEHGIPASTNAGRFQYTGQVWIPELGMYYYKARI